jgi:c-di-GMP phosphodiesterase
VTNDIFLARQPIFDRDRRTFGYELLYRSGPDSAGVIDDPDAATRSVMQRAMLDWGMERIIGNRFGFINASAPLIVSGVHRALPPEGIIIELPICELPDAATVDALEAARRQGYHFALDNVTRLEQLQTSDLIRIVSVIKVEVSDATLPEMTELVEWIRSNHAGTLTVAEKVETATDHLTAVEAGFDLFEGYHFARPEVLRRAARPANMSSTMALLGEMQRPDIDVDRVEEIVGSDPSLAYRILAVVNSSAFGLDRRVDSLRHAIVLLGLGQVRHLATLIALSAADDANEELIAVAAMRARLASEVVDSRDLESGAFTVGLLSVTDALYRTPMEELLEELPVADEISEALLDGTGPYGPALAIARACETADIERLMELVPDRIDDVQHKYADAVEWADGLRDQISPKRSKVLLPDRGDLEDVLA